MHKIINFEIIKRRDVFLMLMSLSRQVLLIKLVKVIYIYTFSIYFRSSRKKEIEIIMRFNNYNQKSKVVFWTIVLFEIYYVKSIFIASIEKYLKKIEKKE